VPPRGIPRSDGVMPTAWLSCGQLVASSAFRSSSMGVHPRPLPAETSPSRTPSTRSRGFLNRESQVRFLPGALSQSPRSRPLFRVFEQRLRVRLQSSGPALAPRRTELRPRCDLNGRRRPRLGQLPRGGARQGNLPTCTGRRGSCSSWLSSSRSTGQDPSPRDPTRLSTSWRRRNLLLLRWFNKAKMTWSPPPVFRCRLVRGFEGFGHAPVGRGTDGRIGRW
jgi:hypothetical protein